MAEAHRLKGSARIVGAGVLGDAAEALEHGVKAQAADLADRADRIVAELRRVEAEIAGRG